MRPLGGQVVSVGAPPRVWESGPGNRQGRGGLKSPNKTLKKGRGGWTSPSRSSMRSIQLISVVDAVGRVHLDHRACCEMSWKREGCVGSKAAGGESAANGVQLVGEAAEAVMSGFLHFSFNYGYEANTQNYCSCVMGTCRRVVPVAQKLWCY